MFVLVLIINRRIIPSQNILPTNGESISPKSVIDRLGVQLGFKTLEDLYQVSKQDKLLSNFQTVLQDAYPQHKWQMWRFPNVPKGYWANKRTHEDFFKWLGTQLGYKSMDDWYNITVEDIVKFGGKALLSKYYNGSPSQAVQSVYPQYNWKLWNFKVAPHGYWEKVPEDIFEQKKIVEWLGLQLAVSRLDDWYGFSLVQVSKLVAIKSSTLFVQMLQNTYPTHHWDKEKLLNPNKPSQRGLIVALQRLFPRCSKTGYYYISSGRNLRGISAY